MNPFRLLILTISLLAGTNTTYATENTTVLENFLHSIIDTRYVSDNCVPILNNNVVEDIKINTTEINDIIDSVIQGINPVVETDPLQTELQKIEDEFNVQLDVNSIVEDLKKEEVKADLKTSALCQQFQTKRLSNNNKFGSSGSLDDFLVGLGNTSFLTVEILSKTLMRKTKVSDYYPAPHRCCRNVTVRLIKTK